MFHIVNNTLFILTVTLLYPSDSHCVVTEREVINGILNVKNTRNHCLAQVRYINNINLQNLRRAGNFIDIANRQVSIVSMTLFKKIHTVLIIDVFSFAVSIFELKWRLTLSLFSFRCIY